MATPETIHNILLLLTANYPTNKMAEQTPILYERLLEDIPDDLLEMAVLDHISKSPYFPKISDLRMRAAELICGDKEQIPPAEAWGETLRLIVTFGSSREDEALSHIKNEATRKAIKALGWRQLCLSTNQVSDRAQFIKVYEQYQRRDVNEFMTLPAIKKLVGKMKMPGLPVGNIEAETSYLNDGEVGDYADIDEIKKGFIADAFDGKESR